MYRRLFLGAAVCFAFLPSIVRAEDMASKIVDYFSGKWEYKAADGTPLGRVDWKPLVGGKCLGGPGESNVGAGFALAGWDAEKKTWVHVWHREDGQHGRLEISRFEGDTYYGDVRVVEGDGKVGCSKWESKVINQDHFIITDRAGDSVTVVHWHRIKE
jgi:hypothetical protein